MKNYHLKPWELDELTIVECSVMLLALKEEDQGGGKLSSSESDDPLSKQIYEKDLLRMMREAYQFNQLPPEVRAREKLRDAFVKYKH